MWNASRCAVRCPIPGSFESSAISWLIGPGVHEVSLAVAQGGFGLHGYRAGQTIVPTAGAPPSLPYTALKPSTPVWESV